MPAAAPIVRDCSNLAVVPDITAKNSGLPVHSREKSCSLEAALILKKPLEDAWQTTLRPALAFKCGRFIPQQLKLPKD